MYSIEPGYGIKLFVLFDRIDEKYLQIGMIPLKL